ncbi:MAG TPA: GNAT family N-acetyltransferase [Blastocatellia bacterium]|nr:GNAT family N-acetyltransferase [Blastocatellia bacterium]
MTSLTSPQPPEYTIRQCTTHEEFTACLAMQKEVWQFADLDVTPLRSFVIAMHGGGFTLGAFDREDTMLGFAHALAAFDRQRRPYYYSQMLAVTERLQNAGIGARLKLDQRDYALERKIPLFTWTFDPLQSRNAYLNIVKLGAVVRRYYANYYGNTSTSSLHAGLDTDRLMVEWWVGSDHVARALEGKGRTDEPVATVEVPFDIQRLKDRDLSEARRWQLQIRDSFHHHLAEGLYCAGFERGRDGGNSRYLFFRDKGEEKAPEY